MKPGTRRFRYVTLDVFTAARFCGNPLAVFLDAEGLSDAEMQALAAEMNYSETTFVLPPEDPANDARVRIFHRTAEMPFAGHPNVGTAVALAAERGMEADSLRFEEQAGLVTVRLRRDDGGAVSGAEIDAPQPLRLLGELPVDAIAACAGLAQDDMRVAVHRPIRAGVGVEFVLAEVTPEALTRAAADLAAFQRARGDDPDAGERLSLLLYARDGTRLRTRMFAPLAGTWEDPATGSANATLAALLLHLEGGDSATFDSVQGVEMGRESRLAMRAWRAADGILASVGGDCVFVLEGFAAL